MWARTSRILARILCTVDRDAFNAPVSFFIACVTVFTCALSPKSFSFNATLSACARVATGDQAQGHLGWRWRQQWRSKFGGVRARRRRSHRKLGWNNSWDWCRYCGGQAQQKRRWKRLQSWWERSTQGDEAQ